MSRNHGSAPTRTTATTTNAPHSATGDQAAGLLIEQTPAVQQESQRQSYFPRQSSQELVDEQQERHRHPPRMTSPPQSASADWTTAQPYLLVPNLTVPDPSVREVDLMDGHPWMVATVIEDDDLMFGGKPLSAWYEEERLRQSMTVDCSPDNYTNYNDYADEEERRGRQRERPRVADIGGHHHQKHHTQGGKKEAKK